MSFFIMILGKDLERVKRSLESLVCTGRNIADVEENVTKLRRLLHNNPITLIVSLWENDPQLAKLAEDSGADALMLNELEKADLVCKNVRIPTGISLKTDKITKKHQKQLKSFDFVNFSIEHLHHFKGFSSTRVAALNENYSIDHLMGIEEKAEVLDAAIVPIKQGVKGLMVGDLQNYISIIISSDIPVIIPTQRDIKPSEVAIIHDAGARGIILTKAVLGATPRSFEKSIREFRIAADDLGS